MATKALGRLMAVLLKTKPTTVVFVDIVHVSIHGAVGKASLLSVVGTEIWGPWRISRGAGTSCCHARSL